MRPGAVGGDVEEGDRSGAVTDPVRRRRDLPIGGPLGVADSGRREEPGHPCEHRPPPCFTARLVTGLGTRSQPPDRIPHRPLTPTITVDAMAHPRMYSDDDPWLTEIRTLCLSFPGGRRGGGVGPTDVPSRQDVLRLLGDRRAPERDHPASRRRRAASAARGPAVLPRPVLAHRSVDLVRPRRRPARLAGGRRVGRRLVPSGGPEAHGAALDERGPCRWDDIVAANMGR